MLVAWLPTALKNSLLRSPYSTPSLLYLLLCDSLKCFLQMLWSFLCTPTGLLWRPLLIDETNYEKTQYCIMNLEFSFHKNMVFNMAQSANFIWTHLHFTNCITLQPFYRTTHSNPSRCQAPHQYRNSSQLKVPNPDTLQRITGTVTSIVCWLRSKPNQTPSSRRNRRLPPQTQLLPSRKTTNST